MFENITYELLLTRMLERALAVDKNIDTREGSLVWYGQAPAAVELQNLYIGMDNVFRQTYALTASREYLILRAKERGLSPYPASPAVLKMAVTPIDLELTESDRFNIGQLNYYVSGKIGDGFYELTCETVGEIGNDYRETLIPIEYIRGLQTCEIVELLIPGEDEEETEAFRQRYFDSLNAQAFGGNQADYLEKVNAIPGVGAVKVYPVWNGDIEPSSLIPGADVTAWFNDAVGTLDAPVAKWLTAVYTAAINKKLTVGGTVRLVIMAANNAAPSDALLDDIQTKMDPTQNAGEGVGLAPIGHVVHVVGVTPVSVDISLNLTYEQGYSWETSKSYVEKVIDDYFEELAEDWAASDHLTVRISHIESRILTECSTMIADIGGTRINGVEKNLVLNRESIPVRGIVDG